MSPSSGEAAAKPVISGRHPVLRVFSCVKTQILRFRSPHPSTSRSTSSPRLAQSYILLSLMSGASDESCYSRTVVQESTQSLDSGDHIKVHSKVASRKATFILLAIFTTSLTMLFIVYLNFPHLEEKERIDFKIPRNKEDAKRLGQLLSRYSDKHFFTVLFGIVVFYIFLQSFAIPGSSWLTVLSGYIFPWPIALLVVCFCSAVGASLCYLICSYWGRPLVLKQFPDRVARFSDLVEAHRSYILLYIIVLRVTPILPNWFINVSSPVIDVPFWPFCIGTFIGVAPLSMMAIGAVKCLGTESMLSSYSMFTVALVAGLAIIHVIRKRFSVNRVIPVIQ